METASPFPSASFADLPAFGVAHATDSAKGTGCTVCVAPAGAVAGVDVRGGAPATRETDLLKPENTVSAIHAVVLSGGSAFGLAASDGVMGALADAGHGFELAGMRVPIVCGASLFDLPVGSPEWPDATMGRTAAEQAIERVGTPFDLEEGNVGAGTGATVGKLLGPEHAMKGGFGWSGVKAFGAAVIALVAVNAAGNVRSADGRWLAGAQRDGAILAPESAFAALAGAQGSPCANTTIGVVLTDAALTKAQAQKVSQMAHDAYARAIWPVHTTHDGDAIFTCASGQAAIDVDLVGVMACTAMQAAIGRAVTCAESAYGLPAARDLTT